MSKVAYTEMNLKPATLALISVVNQIIRKFQAQGYTMSVRQIYYQLVKENIIPNKDTEYKRLASILNDGRLVGLIDWDAIEDRNRDIIERSHWSTGKELLNICAKQFHMDMWDNQAHRVMVIVEKAALVGVLGGTARIYDVPLLAARGYPSVSIVREMSVQNIIPALENGQSVTVLHLGDHDPSGLDMTRDLKKRFDMFLGDTPENNSVSFELKRIALSMDQVDELDPLPNPAKITDSRAAAYIEEYGESSWELDALEPDYINNLVTLEIKDVIDPDSWAERTQEIEDIRAKLLKVANNFKD